MLNREGDVLTGPDAERVMREQQDELRAAATKSLLTQGSIALVLVGGLAAGFGWLVAGRVLAPLHRVTDTARRIAAAPAAGRGLHERIALRGPDDEVKNLADAFDTMVERLDHSFDGQRRFVANASHELRTPLAIQRTVVDVALADPDASRAELRTMATSVRDAVDRSEGLIDGLLVLARSQQGAGATEPVDLAEIAGAALDQVQAEVTDAGLTVRRELRPAPVCGNQVLLERLTANLVQNAVRHNVAGGWVEVSTDGATLTVRNGGAAIPPDQVAGLFEPFRRLAPDRVDAGGGKRGPSGPESGKRGPSGPESGKRGPSGPESGKRGHGLGLSIVEAVAIAHGGTVRADALAGGGLSVTVELQRSSR